MALVLRRGLASGSRHALLLLVSAFALFPFLWALVLSLRPSLNSPLLFGVIPVQLTLIHYQFVLGRSPLAEMIGRTLLVAAVITVAQLVTGVMAAYALARWRVRGGRFLLWLLILSLLIPQQITLIPNYLTAIRLGLLDTLPGLVAPYLVSGLAVVLLLRFVLAFPISTLEAAQLDGASSWRILWSIVVPGLRAPLAATGVLLFVAAWNEHLWPVLVTRSIEYATVPAGIQMFMSNQPSGPLMAAATLSSLPLLLVFLALGHHVFRGFAIR